jgi:hypothetical protein
MEKMEGVILKKKVIVFIILIFFLICVCLFINIKYIFNPFVFIKDNVTYREWSYYQYPAQIEYIVNEDKGGWTMKSVIKNQEEIHRIFNEMKKNQHINFTKNEYYDQEKNNGREMAIIIRHLRSEQTSEGPIVFQFYYFENGNIADLGNMEYTLISDELKELLNKRTK